LRAALKAERGEASEQDGTIADRILNAAYQVFLAHGFSGATTDEIQAACGASKSTIYRYFPSKEILFNAALEAEISTFMQEVRAVEEKFPDITAFLTEFGYRFLSQLLSVRGLNMCRLMIAEGQRFPKLGKMFYMIGPKPISDVVETHLAEAHQRGEIVIRSSPAIATEHFVGMVRGDLHLRCLLGVKPPSEAQLRRFVEATVDAYLDGYRPRG
jgi:AcrR family transcriptional regulator